jgi:hypothetical protein
MKNKFRLSGIVLFCCFLAGCDLFQSLLSPARKITGIWKSTIPVTLYYVTDECLNVESVTRVGEMKFNTTWEIKETIDANEVNITISMTKAEEYKNYGNCELFTGAFWESVDYYTGIISSTSLTLYDLYNIKAGDFTFTTDLMQGTLKDIYSGSIYTFGWESDVNAYKLIRQ